MPNKGPSPAGYHVINLYQSCKRKFYLKIVCGLDAQYTSPALIAGGAFHAGKQVFYETADVGAGMDALLQYVDDEAKEFEYDEDLKLVMQRMPKLYRAWVERHGYSDLVEYDLIAVEKQYSVKLPNGWTATVKPDLVAEHKVSGDIYIFDTKTASYSHKLTADSMEMGDQATLYMYGVRQNIARPVSFVVPDIAYWNKQTQNIDKIQCIRPTIVVRTEEEQLNVAIGFGQEMKEATQRIRAVGEDPSYTWAAFPRNPSFCVAYNRMCEFAPICRANIMPGDVPKTFRSKYANDVDSYVQDSLQIQ